MRAVRRVTISDVARASGVSIATVSRVMNDGPTVSPKLAEQVREVAGRLGYQPNAAAQVLRRGRSGTLGVLVPDLSNPYFGGVLKGVGAAAAVAGYRMLVADANEVVADEPALARDLLRKTDGVILCSPRMSRDDLLALLDLGFPLVAANRDASGLALSTVSIDTYRSMIELCGHLTALGHRRVAYLAGPEHSWSHRERWRALAGTAAFGMEPVSITCGATMEDGHRATDAALATEPTAIIAYNDIVALGALSRAGELGLRVPDDVSITGFDDISFAAYASPALTTVHHPTLDLGRMAWQQLSRLLEGERGLDGERVHGRLVVRASTGTARVMSRTS